MIRKDGEAPLFDGLACERTVTNSNQSVTGTLTTEGFGQTVATTGSSTNPYMFAATSGYRTDGDAGLMHVGARYYDAQVGRFITRDTVLSEKPYVYCNGNPVSAVDPTGHCVMYPAPGGGYSYKPPSGPGLRDRMKDWWRNLRGGGGGGGIGVPENSESFTRTAIGPGGRRWIGWSDKNPPDNIQVPPGVRWTTIAIAVVAIVLTDGAAAPALLVL